MPDAFHRIKSYINREKAVCLLPIIAVLLCLTLSPNWRSSEISGIYISIGNSIAQGNGWEYLGYPTKYPPVLALMLALIIKPFGYNFILMRLLMIASAIASIWLAYLLIRNRTNRWTASAVMCSTAVSFPIFFECTRILSELPYTFLSLFALRWVERYAQKPNSWHSKSGYIAVGLILASYFTRTVGLTLFATTIAYLIAEVNLSCSQLKKVLVVVIVLSTVLLQRHLNPPEYPSRLYLGLSYEREIFSLEPTNPDAPRIGWQDLAERVNGNAKYYQALIANIVLGKDKRVHPEKLYVTASGVLITFAVLAGYIFSVIRHRSVIEYYTFFYLLTYILWPARLGTRFLVPIIPFLFYYLFVFFKQMVHLLIFFVRRWTNRRRFLEITGILVLTGIFVLLNFHENVQLVQEERYRPYYQGGKLDVLRDLVQWLRANTPDDTVIVSNSSGPVQLFFEKLTPRHRTDRKTFNFAWIDHPAEVLQVMDELGTDYVISAPSGRSATYLHPVLNTYPDRFEVIHRHEIYKKYVIYRVLKP